MKCWIFPWRECNVEAEEVPLALCEICVRAYLEHLRNPIIRRRDEPPKG
jgi:hypothetical protein